MTLWSPEYRIIIGGIDLTEISLVGLTIQSGRNNIYSQPQAGYCSIQLINLNNANYNITINDSLTVEVKNSAAVWIPIFGGQISDITNAVHSTGSLALVTRIDILAIGALAKLYKSIWQDSLAQDYDGDQIYAILSSALINSWNEVSASSQWTTYNSTETWAEGGDVGLGQVDQPGQYEMVQRSSSPIDYYSIVTQIANSALGYIFEDATGQVGYADSLHRQNYLIANGYTELDANHAFGAGLKTTTALGNIVNEYLVNYGNNYNNQATALNQNSIDEYGRFAVSVQSNIHDATDAQEVADRQIQLRAYPRAMFDSISFALQNSEIDDADRDALISVFMGLPLKIVNLPSVFGGGEFTGYVEGWTFRSTVNGLSLTLTLSPTEFFAVAQNWNQVSGAETWNSLSNTLEWQDAIGVIS